MTPRRWQELAELFQEASHLEASERTALLDRVRRDAPELHRELESLLFCDERTNDFLEAPALDLAAKLLVDESSRLVGSALAHYDVIEEVGHGGMGVVYRAFDTKLKRPVALKVLAQELVADETHRKLFEDEARAASSLNHPNIVTVHDIGETDGVAFIAMEYVEGRTLKEALSDSPPDLATCLDWAVQIARGLSKAHAAGIVHRDLKPANVMVTDDGFVKILDFGVAQLEEDDPTAGGFVPGTVGYMSPEQAAGAPTGTRSDQYAFGVLLREMTAALPSLPNDLRALVDRCLQDAPEDRFETTNGLLTALESVEHHNGTGSKRRLLAVTAVTAVAITALLVWMFVGRRDAPVESDVEPEAHVAFLKGRHHYLQMTPQDLALARDYFEEAVSIDPGYAEAYAALAECYIVYDGRLLGLHPAQGYAEAKRLAEAALAREPTLAKAHTILGGVYCEFERDFAAAENAFRRAAELNPKDADVHGVYSSCLSRTGRHADAIAQIRRSASLDPLSPLIASQLGFAHYYAREFEEAEARLEEAIELYPNHHRAYLGLGKVYLATHELERAIAALERHAELLGDKPSPWLGHAYAVAGRPEASTIRERLASGSVEGYVSPHDIAIVDLGRGEIELALDGLEKSLDDDPTRLTYLNVEPVYDSLRREPRFIALERKVRYQQ